MATPRDPQIALEVEAFRTLFFEIVNHRIYLPSGLEELIGNRNEFAVRIGSRGQNGNAAVGLMKSGVSQLHVNVLA